jgi:glutamate racemase
MGDKLAIFDSGIGGLSLFYYLKSKLDMPVTYLADNGLFPYGNKSEEELIQIVNRIIRRLKQEHEHIVIACNTASMIYEKHLSHLYQHVYPIIHHTIEEVNKMDGIEKIGIIGTYRTIESGVYQNALLKDRPYHIHALACSELVTYSEDLEQEDLIKDYIKREFSVFKEEKIDLLVLGCTHFNRLKTYLEEYFNHGVIILPSGYGLMDYLLHEVKFENEENKVYLTAKEPEYIKKIIKMIKINHNLILS